MTIDESQAPPRSRAWGSIGAVWIVVLLGVIASWLLVPADELLQWFSIVLGGATILAFCVQLGLDNKVGFVNRMMATVTGAVAILALATGVLALVS